MGTKKSQAVNKGKPASALIAGLLVLGLSAVPVAKADGGSSVSLGDVAKTLAPLSSAAVPQQVGGDIIDRAAAVRLGKALFWDMQSGGDGKIACATCHFHGGVDNRLVNTLHAGNNGIFESGGVTAPGQLLTLGAITSDDRVGSQGIVGALFVGVNPDPTVAADICTPDQTAPFLANRRVTGRQTPPIIGAVLNRNNFWDGRANNNFNGLDPFGATGNAVTTLGSLVSNASLASQSVGPPNNGTEMACGGRNFNGANSLGAKLLARRPLGQQQVSPNDSALGGISAGASGGLTKSYTQLVAAAFGPAIAADARNQFSRIWGQAIQAYGNTLIPDQTPLDRFLAGNAAALTASQQKGLDTFKGKGACMSCHAGPELTDASFRFAALKGLINEDGGDQGFHNVGVRPTAEDPGRAGSGPMGVPWSVSRAAADRGAFKTAALRNVKLTAPYFHNGVKSTLAEVVAFYAKGGDFANPEKAKRITKTSLDAGDQAALVDFLTNALTDCRVEQEAAPFDHPSLAVPNGPSLPATGAAGLGPCQ